MTAVIVFGATGLVGTSLLRKLVERSDVETVFSYGRRAPSLQHAKLKFIEGQYESLDLDLDGVSATASFVALGTTIRKAGSQEAFRDVDFRMVYDASNWAVRNGVNTLSLVSSVGADKKSVAFYSRVKGEIEEALAALEFPRLLIFRPSLLLGSRDEFRFGEAVATPLMRCVNPLMIGAAARYRAISADDVAAAMIRLTLEELAASGKRIVEGREFFA